MATNYRGILTLEKVRLNYQGNLLWYCFITLAPGLQVVTVKAYKFHLPV
jgi:hypothetical protein